MRLINISSNWEMSYVMIPPSVTISEDYFVDFECPANTLLYFKEISETEILRVRLLHGLSVSKASVVDQISARILKIASHIIVPSLTSIFNQSIRTGIFPTDWKSTRVTPIYKSGEKCKMSNYRPISVISIVARIMENKLIHNQIYKYLITAKLREAFLIETPNSFGIFLITFAISFRKKRYMLRGRNTNMLPRTDLIQIPLLYKCPALHNETMNMKIPVKITQRSNPNSLVNCNTSYTNTLINKLNNKGHNKANCIQINISPCQANLSKSRLPSLLLTNVYMPRLK